MTTRSDVAVWLEELKAAWEGGDPDRALRLFASTERYYERPFKAGTTQEEFRTYWQDIVGLDDIEFDFQIEAVEGDTACVHWVNKFVSPSEEGKRYHLDGVFIIRFADDGSCREFSQWWFMKP